MARAMIVDVRGGIDRRLFLSTASSDPGRDGVMTTDDQAPSTLFSPGSPNHLQALDELLEG